MYDSPSQQDLKYLSLLSEQFPTTQSVFTEIINLQAILNLPKATEHFMSDIHGEHEAFIHILNNCSGVIRERVSATFSDVLTPEEQADLCTLIYYPREKLQRIKQAHLDSPTWYRETLHQMVRLARLLSNNYTRSKVRKAMPVEYAYIIDELLHEAGIKNMSRHNYHVRILESILETGSEADFIISLASLIKRLAVDHLHIVGDIYDRGPHADRIVDELMRHHSIDIQWGNHDILWMGAAAGSEACIANVIRNNVRYNLLEILESAYGISLRELALFADKLYNNETKESPMEKAITRMLFKLEGQIIMRRPEFDMADRLLLEHLDLENKKATIDGVDWELSSLEFPTIDPDDPYTLSDDEREVMDGLVHSFLESERLQRHIDFLYDHGSMYLVQNDNLLFHGCIPMNEDGTFRMVQCAKGSMRSGKNYFDFCERIARRAWHYRDEERLDWMWYLWCGKLSPLSGRIVKTFERSVIADKTSWEEPRDTYWDLTVSEKTCSDVLAEFGVRSGGHIINGHTPIKLKKGEKPIRGGGKLLVIDGGFCNAYHEKTGIAGFTLITDSEGMRLKAHLPFKDVEAALDENADIESNTSVIEKEERSMLISDTDTGAQIREQIADLKALLEAYRSGELKEHEEH